VSIGIYKGAPRVPMRLQRYRCVPIQLQGDPLCMKMIFEVCN